jgi:hypothetical protein
MPTVKIKLYKGNDHIIATKSIDLGKSAQHFEDSDFAGPTFKVTDKKDQHPNEVRLCMTKIKGGDCGAVRNIGKGKYDIEFFVRGLN